jgi:hypothetical protein
VNDDLVLISLAMVPLMEVVAAVLMMMMMMIVKEVVVAVVVVVAMTLAWMLRIFAILAPFDSDVEQSLPFPSPPISFLKNDILVLLL